MATHRLMVCFMLILATPLGVAALRTSLPQAAMTTAAFNRDDAVSCNGDAHFFAPEDCHIFEDDTKCLQHREQITWLASFPGSGNTWTRSLLESATGLYTGSIYHDPTLIQAGMKGEGIKDPSKVLVVKMHYFPKHEPPTEGRAVVLVRDPLHAVLSFTSIKNAAAGSNRHGAEIQQAELKKLFAKSRNWLLNAWGGSMAFWLQQYNHSRIIVRYEDLVNDTRATLTKQILPFLGIRPSKLGKRLHCALQPQAEESDLQRNHSYDFAFEAEDYAAVKSILGDLPSQFGYHY